ncbi:hypothetical protein XELAEV_18012365mg, partial [Xenopus laevis]
TRSPEIRTTVPTSTLRSMTTFTNSNNQIHSAICSECCLEIILAFFSGGLFTILVILIVFCVIKLKGKGNQNVSAQSNKDKQNVTHPDDFQMVSENENLTYAKIMFVNRESSAYDNF